MCASSVNFELKSGFRAEAVPSCACLGDMNSDGDRSGADISGFVGFVIQGGACVCADTDAMNGVTLADVTVFVADLLVGTGCPWQPVEEGGPAPRGALSSVT